MRLLFVCAHWHGLAKLRLHSDLTLDVLDDVTTTMGDTFRHFQQVICPIYSTQELPREADARRRTNIDRTANLHTDVGPSKKEFNIQIYKYHALGDYVKTIRQLGTTDSYSTAIVSHLANIILICQFTAYL
jgi:hypothetical protein